LIDNKNLSSENSSETDQKVDLHFPSYDQEHELEIINVSCDKPEELGLIRNSMRINFLNSVSSKKEYGDNIL
jgi:hypothetical protein